MQPLEEICGPSYRTLAKPSASHTHLHPRKLYVLNSLPCGHPPRALKRPCITWLYCQNLVSDGKCMRLLHGELRNWESFTWKKASRGRHCGSSESSATSFNFSNFSVLWKLYNMRLLYFTFGQIQ